ncbi:hypothetical protein B0H34DRAFT_804288 [Crassisporium funariophilum]|nr:hypothetical protein B0H34DRAFT_804288 [Crassisporium funariophilum]
MFNYWASIGKDPQSEAESRDWAQVKNKVVVEKNNLTNLAVTVWLVPDRLHSQEFSHARQQRNKLHLMQRSREPEEIKRRLAGKFHKKRVHQAMQDQYREIGLSSIVIAAYTREDGKLVVDAYDHISELTGVALPSFEQMYSNEMLTMKASLLKYLLAIQVKQIQGATTIGATVNAEGPKVALTYTAAGFPILPRPMSTRGWKKDHWETLFMDYMGCHYKLATGGKSSHPPYGDIQQQQMTFIENKYLPRNMKIAQAPPGDSRASTSVSFQINTEENR